MPSRGSPSSLTVDQLTRELKLRNVSVPKSSIRKEVLVDLYKKHVLNDSVVNSTDVFSSDDDADLQGPNSNESNSHDQEMTEMDILNLSDSELRTKLKSYDANVGPITNSTRSIYRKKLAKFLKGELMPPNQNATPSPAATTTYSDDENDDDVDNESSNVSTHDVSIQNDFEYEENGDKHDEEIDTRDAKVTETVKEVTETRFSKSIHHSTQPFSSIWTRTYEEDNTSSAGGSSRIRKPFLSEETQLDSIRRGMSDDLFASNNISARTTPSRDFHRRSMALYGLTPRPALSTYSPSRVTPSRISPCLHEAGDSAHQSGFSSHSLRKEKVKQKGSYFKNSLVAIFVIVVLSLFGYAVYLNVESDYFPMLR